MEKNVENGLVCVMQGDVRVMNDFDNLRPCNQSSYDYHIMVTRNSFFWAWGCQPLNPELFNPKS